MTRLPFFTATAAAESATYPAPCLRQEFLRLPRATSGRHGQNVTIDWTIRENVRAHLRALVKRVLRKYGYPPDKQAKATQTVIEQAEILCNEWAA